MIVRLTLLGSTVLALLATPAAAAVPASGWSFETVDGSVHVSADRKHITVCDEKDDGTSVNAEYATSILGTYKVSDGNGPRSGCGTDSTLIFRIDVFKMCITEGPFRNCHRSVWIK
ncbi:hypothetical protein [Nonomuraea sp. NPDC046570]|uniref:hypothetical protein n=1 Tax=Nonomuraea sp. NPDC046570 TaxID=3155255 RepID=UPI0033FBABD8